MRSSLFDVERPDHAHRRTSRDCWRRSVARSWPLSLFRSPQGCRNQDDGLLCLIFSTCLDAHAIVGCRCRIHLDRHNANERASRHDGDAPHDAVEHKEASDNHKSAEKSWDGFEGQRRRKGRVTASLKQAVCSGVPWDRVFHGTGNGFTVQKQARSK